MKNPNRFERVFASAVLSLSWPLAVGCDDEGSSCHPADSPRYVAVGDDGLILVSSDPASCWAKVASPTTKTLKAVANDGQGHWVAVGEDLTVVRSLDGADTWQSAAALDGGGTLRNLATDRKGRWLAVGTLAKVYRSTDNGDSWQVINPGDVAFKAIATDGTGRWAAAGGAPHFSVDDGETWTFAQDSNGAGFNNMAYGAGRFVASQEFPAIYTSGDGGSSWTIVTTEGLWSHWYGVEFDARADQGQRWMAGGAYGHMAYSADGVSWSSMETPLYALGNEVRVIRDVVYGDDRWVAVSARGDVLVQTGSHEFEMHPKVAAHALNAIGYSESPDLGQAQNGGCLFCESFEDGDWLGWGDAGGAYTISIVPTDTLLGAARPQGTYSLSLTGGGRMKVPRDGIFHRIQGQRPAAVSFRVRGSALSPQGGNVELSQKGLIGIAFALNPVDAGTFSMSLNGKALGTLAKDTWAHIILQDFDWVNAKFDVLVNGSEVLNEEPLTISGIDRLDLYNAAFGQFWFDDLELMR